MAQHLHFSDLEVISFHSYTTQVHDVICTYDTLYYKDEYTNKWMEDLYEHLCQWAEEQCRKGGKQEYVNFKDNKACFKVKHKRTGVYMYLGYYDNVYELGLSGWQNFGYVYDFGKKEMRDNVDSEFI